MTPFYLRILVADGDLDGLRIVDKSNWIGKALVVSRVQGDLARCNCFEGYT